MATAANAPSVRYRISAIQEIFILATAIILDGAGFILMLTVLGETGTEVIGIAGEILFLVWFWFLGADYLSGNAQSKLLTLLGNGVVEAVPFVNGVYPGFTVQAWRLISIMKKEDEEKAKRAARKRDVMQTRLLRQQQRVLQIRARQIQAAQATQAANDEEALAEAA